MAEYESGNTSKVNSTLYNTLKKELNNAQSVLGEPIKEETNV